MHPVRKQRLFFVVFIVVASSVAVALMVYMLRENMNMFYPPSNIAKAPIGKNIRAGGCVVPGTVLRDESSLAVRFDVTDGAAQMSVVYEGLLPDLFAEGEAAVLTGQLDGDGVFKASEVLAKHDETYMPPEVADAMQKEEPGYEKHTARCGDMKYGS